MNERINELAKQVPGWNCCGVFTGPYEKSLEKFTELIVRECAQVAEEVDGDSRSRKCVLEHFGVEE
jgi:hypothetical protein